jgi:hypothetical protein
MIAAAAFAVQLYDVASWGMAGDGINAGKNGLLRVVQVVLVGLFIAWAFFWILGAGNSAETRRESQGG